MNVQEWPVSVAARAVGGVDLHYYACVQLNEGV